VPITFFGCASLSKVAEPIKYFRMTYSIFLKGSFNHVISLGLQLEFCIKFDTLCLLLSDIMNVMHNKHFCLLAMIASE
jgi:hypothetical protein